MAELNNFRKFPSPYIFENGGGLSWPSATAPEIIGRSADEISDLLDYIRDEHLFNFRLFRDISVVEIAGRTGLTEAGARKAKARQTSMPIIWTDTQESLERFPRNPGFIGLQVVGGGLSRRCSISVARLPCSASSNNSTAVNTVQSWYCGDAENDLDMMTLADTAVLFPNKAGQYIPFDTPDCTLRKTLATKRGWSLQQVQLKRKRPEQKERSI